jgi:hypothetical protein
MIRAAGLSIRPNVIRTSPGFVSLQNQQCNPFVRMAFAGSIFDLIENAALFVSISLRALLLPFRGSVAK